MCHPNAHIALAETWFSDVRSAGPNLLLKLTPPASMGLVALIRPCPCSSKIPASRVTWQSRGISYSQGNKVPESCPRPVLHTGKTVAMNGTGAQEQTPHTLALLRGKPQHSDVQLGKRFRLKALGL